MAAETDVPANEFLAQNTGDSSSLLIIVGEPFTEEHKGLILERIAKGIKSWDTDSAGCDINGILADVASQAPQPAFSETGETLIESAGEKVSVTVLINPQLETLHGKLRNFLKAPAKYRHVVYAGHVFQGSGNWVLQDDHVSFAKFASVFKEAEVSNALKAQEGSVLSLNVFKDGDWSEGHVTKQGFSKIIKVKFNPDAKLEETGGLEDFICYLTHYVKVTPTKNLLKSSDVVGNIRFSRPTLYIFPGCQGDSALLGVSGFNLLVNGGYSRKACFWDFARHLDRVDAMLLTHLGEDNLFGVSSVLQRKTEDRVHPEIGYMLFNGVESQKHSPNGDLGAENGGLHKEASLKIDLIEEGDKLMQYMHAIGQSPHTCIGKMQGSALQSVNLYHKVGHGSLDMYLLNPLQDSKDLKEFMSQWSKHGHSFTSKGGIPLPNMLSVCSLLVWKPSSPNEKITRILFPGGVPQSRLFEGLDKLKNEKMFQHATCTEHSLKAPAGKAGKKTIVGRVAPKNSPGGSPRSTTPKGSLKSIPDKIKPSTKPSSAPSKLGSKPTKEAPKKTTAPAKDTSKKPVKDHAKPEKEPAEEKLASPIIPRPEIVSPAESSGTQDTTSTTDLQQMAAAVGEELSRDEQSSSQPSPLAEAPVEFTDVKPDLAAKPIAMESEAIPDLVDISTKEEARETVPERQKSPVLEPEGDQLIDRHTAEVSMEKMPETLQEAEMPAESPVTDSESHQEIIQSQEESPVETSNQQLLDFGEEPAVVQTKDLDSPEPLPEPQQFQDGDFGANEDVIQSKVVEQDDEKDVDTSEAPMDFPTEAALSEKPEVQTPDDAAAFDVDEQSPIIDVSDDLQPQTPVDNQEAFKQDDECHSMTAPDLLMGDATGAQNGVGFETQQELADDQIMAEEESKSDSISQASNPPDLLASHEQEHESVQQLTPESPRPEVEGALVDPEDIDVRNIKGDDHPFDGAQPEGLPSPREVPEVIPDEIIDTHDLVSTDFKDNLINDNGQSQIEEFSNKFEDTAIGNQDLVEKVDTIPVESKPGDKEEQVGESILDNNDIPQEMSHVMEETMDEPAEESPTAQNNEGIFDQSHSEQDRREVAVDKEEKVYEASDDEDVQQDSDEELQTEVVREDQQMEEESLEKTGAEMEPMIESPLESHSEIEIENQQKPDIITSSQEADLLENDEPEEVKLVDDNVRDDQEEPRGYAEISQQQESEKVLEETPAVTSHEPQLLDFCDDSLNFGNEYDDVYKQDEDINQQQFQHIKLEESTGPEFCDDSLNFGNDGVPAADSHIQEPLGCHHTEQDVLSSPDLEAKIEESPVADDIAMTDENGSSIEPEKEEQAEDVKQQEVSHEREEERHDLIPPPECDLYSNNSFGGDVPQEPLEPAQPNECRSMFNDQSFSQDPLQGWQTSEKSNNQFIGLTPTSGTIDDHEDLPEGFQQQSDIPFDSRRSEAQPSALEDFHSTDTSQQQQGEFDPVKEWGMPMGLPAPSPGTNADKKATAKPEAKKPATTATSTKSAASKTRTTTTTKSRLNTSTVASRKAGADASKESKEGTSSASRLSATTKKTPKSPAVKENGAKKTSALDRSMRKDTSSVKKELSTAKKETPAVKKESSTLKKDPASSTAKKTTTTKKAPTTTRSLDTSRLSAPKNEKLETSRLNTTRSEKLDTSKMESAKPASRTVGAKRPATAPGGRAPAPVKLQPVTPFYVDLAYIPYHGDSNYMTMDYFRRVRARHYVYSALQPDPEIFDSLLEAKKTWGDDQTNEVTVIPTYDNEALRLWMRQNNEKLMDLKVDIAPSASRCTIQLQDHETSCAAYRLEF